MPLSSLPLQIKDEGTSKGYATEIDFVGAGVTVAMSGSVLNRATVTIATNLAPAVDETVAAGYSAIAVRSYTIASGKKLTIGSAGIFRIL